jgi:hypothetical protein
MENNFNTPFCKGQISMKNNDIISVVGQITIPFKNKYMTYVSSAPYDRLSSFSGSGLPFPNKDVAFQNNPNKGKIDISKGTFDFTLIRPNSFYENFDVLRTPFLRLTLDNNMVSIDLPYKHVAYRGLQHPSMRKNPMFYNVKQPIRSQEKVLRDSEYMVYDQAPNFWGLKPPIA